jgi:hypothetical protein
MWTAASDVAEFLKTESMVVFPTGGRILLRSLDNPETKRGWTADGVVIDECASVDEAAWYEVFRPMLIDTGGSSWCIGTPMGRNWFWRECMNACDRDDSVFWNAPTLGMKITESGLTRVEHPLENPFIQFDEMEQVWKTTPERVFRQEILAEFIDESGGVFRNVRAAVDRHRTQSAPLERGARYVIGVDLARAQDWTVICVLQILPNGKAKQVYFERFNQISWERQEKAILAAHKAYPGQIILDSTGVGDPIFERIRRTGVNTKGFQITGASKEPLIDNAAMMIEHGNVRLMDIDAQTNELLAYQYEITRARNVKMNAPQGMHDDCVIALALALQGIGRTPTWDVM